MPTRITRMQHNALCQLQLTSNKPPLQLLNKKADYDQITITVYPEILAVIKFGDLPEIWQKCIIGSLLCYIIA